MASDVNFDFTWVPNRYVDRLQRAAVLYPLTGPCHSVAEIGEHTLRLQGQWRARLHALELQGWSPRRGDAQGMEYTRNCLPAFVYAEPRTKQCGGTTFCPFCYSRWVRDVWLHLDPIFPNQRDDCSDRFVPTDTSPVDETLGAQGMVAGEDRELRPLLIETTPREFPFHMVTRFQQWKFPYEVEKPTGQSPEARLRELMDHAVAARYRKIRTRNFRGAFAHMTVEPTKFGWLFRNRELYLVDRDAVVPEPRHSTVHRCTEPTRGAVLQALIRVCRYPPLLLTGDPERAAVLLRARKGACLSREPIRLSATYGCFRNRRQDHGVPIRRRGNSS